MDGPTRAACLSRRLLGAGCGPPPTIQGEAAVRMGRVVRTKQLCQRTARIINTEIGLASLTQLQSNLLVRRHFYCLSTCENNAIISPRPYSVVSSSQTFPTLTAERPSLCSRVRRASRLMLGTVDQAHGRTTAFIYPCRYWPCFLVLRPYWMANFGQRCRQPKHMAHRSFTHTGRLSCISMACTGHLLAHRPQPMQPSSRIRFFVRRVLAS